VLREVQAADAPAPEVQAIMGANGTRSFVFAGVHAGVQADAALIGGLVLRWYAAPTEGTDAGPGPLVPLAGARVGGRRGTRVADALLAALRRKRIEEALLRSESALRRGQALAHVGSYIFDLQGTGQNHWSDETFRIIGLSPQEGTTALTEGIARYVHPDDRDA